MKIDTFACKKIAFGFLDDVGETHMAGVIKALLRNNVDFFNYVNTNVKTSDILYVGFDEYCWSQDLDDKDFFKSRKGSKSTEIHVFRDSIVKTWYVFVNGKFYYFVRDDIMNRMDRYVSAKYLPVLSTAKKVFDNVRSYDDEVYKVLCG